MSDEIILEIFKDLLFLFFWQFPMTYSCGTSTTELSNKELNLRQQLSNHNNSCKCCSNITRMSDRSTCMQDEPLGAREQLKQKKLNDTLDYIC